MNLSRITVHARSPEGSERAQVLTQYLRDHGAELPADHHLHLAPDGLTLTDPMGRSIRPDWTSLDITSGPGRSRKAPIYRAVASRHRPLKNLIVLDTTAGWGEDSLLLLASGCRVIACERNPVVAALLADAAHRFSAQDNSGITSRLTILHVDSRKLLTDDFPPSVLFGEPPPALHEMEAALIDPMFPSERKAAERQLMKSLRALVPTNPHQEDAALLEAALQNGIPRVAVKRPRKADFLIDTPPQHSVEGRGFRFDVYFSLVAG